jgi:hypothetical protein
MEVLTFLWRAFEVWHAVGSLVLLCETLRHLLPKLANGSAVIGVPGIEDLPEMVRALREVTVDILLWPRVVLRMLDDPGDDDDDDFRLVRKGRYTPVQY